MIDLHCHVLPGIDDGPATIEDSLALARAAAAAGIRTIVATPHVSRRYPNDAATIAELVDRAECAPGRRGNRAGGPRRRRDRDDAGSPRSRRRNSPGSALGGGRVAADGAARSRRSPAGLTTSCCDLAEPGHRIVLAHPERCPAFHRDPRMLGSLVRGGVAHIDHGRLARGALRWPGASLRARAGPRRRWSTTSPPTPTITPADPRGSRPSWSRSGSARSPSG